MSSTAPISVVMCMYNAEKYLRWAVECILGQTFHDFEFIIVDDGSTDCSAQIVESYCDPRIRLIQQPNGGPAVARNAGIMATRTPLVAVMDADDGCAPDRLEQQYAFMRANPMVAAVGCAARIIDQSGKLILLQRAPTGSAFCRWRLMNGRFYTNGPSLMIRREALEAIGVYRPLLCPREDVDLMLRLAESYQIDNVPQELYYYRINLAGLSHSDLRKGLWAYDLAFALHRERLARGSDRLQRGDRIDEVDAFPAQSQVPSDPRRIRFHLHLEQAELRREQGALGSAVAHVVRACLCVPPSLGMLRSGSRVLFHRPRIAVPPQILT